MKMLKFPDELEKFGRNLEALRKELKKSQKEICDEAHLEQSYLPLIESGGKNISLNVILAIAFAMNMHPLRLFAICMSSAYNIRHSQLNKPAVSRKEIHLQATADGFPKKEMSFQPVEEASPENEIYLQLIREEFPEMEMLLQ